MISFQNNFVQASLNTTTIPKYIPKMFGFKNLCKNLRSDTLDNKISRKSRTKKKKKKLHSRLRIRVKRSRKCNYFILDFCSKNHPPKFWNTRIMSSSFFCFTISYLAFLFLLQLGSKQSLGPLCFSLYEYKILIIHKKKKKTVFTCARARNTG